jgi:protein O-mannosyl-transferase
MKDENGATFKSLFLPLTIKKAFIFIFLIGLVVFFNGMFNGFVGDDAAQITENINIHSLDNLPYFFLGSTFYSGGGQALFGAYYKPALSISYALIYSVFGSQASAFHSFQIFLYIVNSCLLYLLFKVFFRGEIAFVLSLIFLVHPINSESAFYISATQEVLYFFFGILALLILQAYGSAKAVFLSGVLLFFSILSKETGILFFAVSMVYVSINKRKHQHLLLGCLSIILLAYLALRIHAIGLFTPHIVNAPIQNLDLLSRGINMPAIFLFYLQTFFFPQNLAVSYHWINKYVNLNDFFWPLIIGLIFIAVLSWFARFLYNNSVRKEFYLYIFFFLWFLSGIVFHLQIIPLDQTVADRWFYFPIVGLLGMMGVVIEKLKINLKNKLSIIILILLIGLLSSRTIVRGLDWRDSLILASRDIKISKEAFNLENGMSAVHFEQGEFIQAKIHAEKSIMLFPNMFNYTNLGASLFSLGDYQKSKEANFKALQYGAYYKTYENLAALALVYGDPVSNIDFIRNIALKKYFNDSTLWFYLATLEYVNGKSENARVDIGKAFVIDQGPRNSFMYDLINNNKQLNIKIKNGVFSYSSS